MATSRSYNLKKGKKYTFTYSHSWIPAFVHNWKNNTNVYKFRSAGISENMGQTLNFIFFLWRFHFCMHMSVWTCVNKLLIIGGLLSSVHNQLHEMPVTSQIPQYNARTFSRKGLFSKMNVQHNFGTSLLVHEHFLANCSSIKRMCNTPFEFHQFSCLQLIFLFWNLLVGWCFTGIP
jgi:hypothetical protein